MQGSRAEPVRAYSVMRAVRALELLAFRPMSAPELAHALQTAERTARRLLQRLELEEHVTMTGGYRRRYHLTLRLAVLGRQAIARTQWLRTAVPFVAALAGRTRATAQLWIPAYTDVACVLEARPGGPLPEPMLGTLVAAQESAPGKVLLAHREPWRESVLRADVGDGVHALTLGDELRRIRAGGRAIKHHQGGPGLAIAAPVLVGADATAAIGISFSHARVADVVDALAGHVVDIAGALGEALTRPDS